MRVACGLRLLLQVPQGTLGAGGRRAVIPVASEHDGHQMATRHFLGYERHGETLQRFEGRDRTVLQQLPFCRLDDLEFFLIVFMPWLNHPRRRRGLGRMPSEALPEQSPLSLPVVL